MAAATSDVRQVMDVQVTMVTVTEQLSMGDGEYSPLCSGFLPGSYSSTPTLRHSYIVTL